MSVSDLAVTVWCAAGDGIDIFGLLGMILGFAAGVMPRRSWLLIAAAACATSFGLHYLHLGALTGATMCAIAVLQNLIAARLIGPDGRAAWTAPLFAASSLAAACLILATWDGWPSACAGTGALLATAARLQARPQVMRRLFLGASACWAGHNILVGSAFGLTCDVMTILGLAIALARAAQPRPEALAQAAVLALDATGRDSGLKAA